MLICLRGLPASGKSTWAKEWVADDPGNRARVNRDDIRFQLFGGYTGVDEDLVTKVETAMVKAALDAGKDVVVDACHLAARYVKRWAGMVPQDQFLVCNFWVPVQECIDRDYDRYVNRRDRGVGAKVIKNMAKRYHVRESDGYFKDVDLSGVSPSESFKKYTPTPGLREAYIFDLDGTLAHNDGHRSFYDYSKVFDDKVHDHVKLVANMLRNQAFVIIVSGRKAECEEDTRRWLRVNGISFDELYMRADGDDRKDSIVKNEILHEKIADRYNVKAVFDDRPSVCRMWRSVGIPTFQLGDPEFEF